MDVSIKNLDKAQVEAIISLNSEDMEKYLDSAAKRLGKNLKVKGFREGKVPRTMVEKELGKDAVWEEALPEAIEDLYWKVVEEKDIEAIGRPSISVSKSVPFEVLEFKAKIPVMPDLELPDYKSIAKKVREKEKRDIIVEDKEVEDALKWLQRSRATGSGEEKDAEKSLPEINDEFAKNIGGFDNLDALKKSIKEGLEKEKEEQEKQRLRLLTLEKIREKVKLPIAESLMEEELNKMEQELRQQIEQMNMTIDQYLKNVKKDLKSIREEWKDKAKERVSAGILLRAIGDKENVSPSDKEIEEEANKYLLRFGSPEEAAKAIDPKRLRSYIHGIMRNEKVFELLEGNNSNKDGDGDDKKDS
ncbi:MAG: trigger factor [Candidatus Spechtbacterales bacterium]|nr:trigger factor [Candidatus Spechtbacterales bacterium]